MAYKKGLGEMVKEVQEVRAPNAKKKMLREYGQAEPALVDLLKYAFHPGIKFLLPETNPPYTPTDKNMDIQGQMFAEIKRMYIFCEGGIPTLKQARREQLFIGLLESVDPDDAELLLSIKNRKISGITEEMFRECFPGVLPDTTDSVQKFQRASA